MSNIPEQQIGQAERLIRVAEKYRWKYEQSDPEIPGPDSWCVWKTHDNYTVSFTATYLTDRIDYLLEIDTGSTLIMRKAAFTKPAIVEKYLRKFSIRRGVDSYLKHVKQMPKHFVVFRYDPMDETGIPMDDSIRNVENQPVGVWDEAKDGPVPF
jgi:hypothetical protein